MELLTKLGIDWRLLIAQIFNFSILILVLYKFLYKPLLTVLDKRRERIEKSLEDAAKIEADTKRFAQLKEEKVQEAKREAAKVLEEAAALAETQRQTTVEKTKQESAAVVAKAREQIVAERAEAMRGVQAETAQLVVMAAERVLKEKMDDAKDRKFVEETIQQISSATRA